MTIDRCDELERYGRIYGELHLAVAFTEGLEGEAAKRVTARGWDKTLPLADGDHGAAMLHRGQKRNPAIVLGPSNLVGFDVDGPEGVTLLKQHVPEGLPLTVTVETGREDGFHFWFKRPAGATYAFVQLGEHGVQVKTGQYLVAPPGLHPEGRAYRFAEGRAPWEVPLAVLPARILNQLERAGRAQNGFEHPATDQPTSEGGRHDRLMRLGCAMRRRGACLQAVEAALLAENAAMCIPPQPTETVIALARDLHRRYGPVQA